MGAYFFDTSALVKRYVTDDAVQLACALETRNKLAALEIPTLTFVSADTELLSMANAEGLSIENPNLFL
jgi:predicted nucleic acid-binding protein